MVLVRNSVQDLLNSLNQPYDFCQYWGLEVHTEKTKIVVFRKGSPALPSEQWYYNNQVLEVADDFNYLGTVWEIAKYHECFTYKYQEILIMSSNISSII